MKKLTKDSFIEKSKKIHNNKYDYSLIEYKNSSTKVKIICPIHDVFNQMPNNHLNGQGCPECANIIYNTKRTNNFIEKSKKVHGDKYDYSLVDYVNTDIKVKIICPIHDVFEQTPHNHLGGSNCPNCSYTKQKTNDRFITESIKVHGDKYDYSLVEYKNNKTKVKIICSKHKIFEQIPKDHLNGSGCPSCVGLKKYTTDEFIKKCKEIHGNNYDYSLVNYIDSHKKIKIICKKHNKLFIQKPNKHLNGQGCPKCKLSKGENKIRLFLENNNIEFILNKKFSDCKNLLPLPFDFYLPKHNICIEYDGEQHFNSIEKWGGINQLKKIQQRDKIKTEYCKNNNIQLIRIKYDEDIKDKLRSLFNK